MKIAGNTGKPHRWEKRSPYTPYFEWKMGCNNLWWYRHREMIHEAWESFLVRQYKAKKLPLDAVDALEEVANNGTRDKV